MNDYVVLDVGLRKDCNFSHGYLGNRIDEVVHLLTKDNRELDFLLDWRRVGEISPGPTVQIHIRIPDPTQLSLFVKRSRARTGTERWNYERDDQHRRIDDRIRLTICLAKEVFNFMINPPDERIKVAKIEIENKVSTVAMRALALRRSVKTLRIYTPQSRHRLDVPDVPSLFAVGIEGSVRFLIIRFSRPHTRAICKITWSDGSFEGYLKALNQSIELFDVAKSPEIMGWLHHARDQGIELEARVRVAVSTASFRSCKLEATSIRIAGDGSAVRWPSLTPLPAAQGH